MADVTLEMLQALIQRANAEQTAIRRENNENRTLLLATVDQGRRIERRLNEITADIELMVKSELMGRLGHFEIQMEGRLEAMEGRLEAIETRLPKQ